ncbi:MAG: phosphoglycerate dehydrogenase [Ignavibacterium sp.]|jgi:D-3-phosphoglycerate dehydrogenase|nr:phosphoglycerate dehydrogenase [Ignavibacterium sp.]
MKKILISDQVNEKSVALLESAGFEVTYNTKLTRDELLKIIPDFNALIVRSATKVDSELISAMINMEVIGRAGTGVDNIDINAASRKGILVMNTPDGNTISTAEHTFAMILSLCRNIPQAVRSLAEGNWDRKKYSGTELRGKILAVIGLGKIGKEVAKRAKAFGMNVIGFDPLISSDKANELGVEIFPLDQIWSKADFITVHVPINDSTKNLISKTSFEKCKKGVKIINCARGGIVNEQDIVEAIDKGIVSGAAFDVYSKEPPEFSNVIFNHPKIICTPHLGASTDEAQELVAIQISEQIRDYFQNNKITAAVNIRGFAENMDKDSLSFIHLCESLGIFTSQLLTDQLKSIDINLSGKSLHKYDAELSTAFQKGFLTNRVDQIVTFVNAQLLFDEMNIPVNIKKSDDSSIYKNLVTAEIHTDKEVRVFAATLFGVDEIRIVRIDNYDVELNPTGFMLLYINEDRPGMLASVGKILADANINIAGLSLGRIEKGKQALTFINIDSRIPENIIQIIKSLDGIFEVYQIFI